MTQHPEKGKGRTPLQRPAPNNQTNQPLSSELRWMGKPKTHPASCLRLIDSDSYFTRLFNYFFYKFCNRSSVNPSRPQLSPYFSGFSAFFRNCKKVQFFPEFLLFVT